MADISTQQLAELLSGIARAQAAIVQGLESAMPGARSTHVVPALQNAAHVRDHPDPTLVDLPVRVLLAYMGRVGPDPANIARDLERALAGLPPMTMGAAPEFAAPSETAGESLDFTEPQ